VNDDVVIGAQGLREPASRRFWTLAAVRGVMVVKELPVARAERRVNIDFERPETALNNSSTGQPSLASCPVQVVRLRFLRVPLGGSKCE